MRPLYVLLLAGTDHPRASGFFPSPSAFVASPFLQRTEQSRCGEASLELSRTTSSKRSRRVRQRSTSISSSTTAGCWRHTHHDGAWTCTAAAAGWQPPCNRRSGWTGPSASRAWGVQHAPPSCSAVGGSTFPPSSITTSSSSSSIRSSTRRRATRIEATAASSTSTSSIVAARRSAAEEAQTASLQQQETVEDEDDDPTAAAHGYLADFLGMTEEVRALPWCRCMRWMFALDLLSIALLWAWQWREVEVLRWYVLQTTFAETTPREKRPK